LLERIEELERRLANVPGSTPPEVSSPDTQEASGEEDDATGSLERALVREGGFLLPPRKWEIEPRLIHDHRETVGLGIVSATTGPQVAETSRESDRSELSLSVRAGLPRSMQVEVRLPHVWTRENVTVPALSMTESTRRNGHGGIEVLLTRQFSEDNGGFPAVLGSLVWKDAAADTELGELSPGVGFASGQATLTMVKRQDPLVFYGTLSYTAYRARRINEIEFEPGRSVGLRFGGILAASPSTSLRGGIDLNRHDGLSFAGEKTSGSDELIGVIEFGLATLISAGTLLDMSLSVGVTENAPDLRLGISIPIRL
jgi:hypothetical protein